MSSMPDNKTYLLDNLRSLSVSTRLPPCYCLATQISKFDTETKKMKHPSNKNENRGTSAYQNQNKAYLISYYLI